MNVLREYLVKLGWESDQHSFSKMQGMLAQAERSVTANTGGMVKSIQGAQGAISGATTGISAAGTKMQGMVAEAEHSVTAATGGIVKRIVEAQGAIIGAFTGISAAIIGMVDKVAMADQGYRLLGERMMMTKESARAMDMITTALGASMEEIIWDPELRKRAGEMFQHIKAESAMLGPGFEQNMKGIRDIRAQFAQLGVDVKFLGMKFASDLYEKMGGGQIAGKVEGWVTWLEQQIPELADKISTCAVPVLTQTWEILKAAGQAGEAFVAMFTNAVGLLSGDESIQGTATNFETLVTALQHVGTWMEKFIQQIVHSEMLLAHFSIGTMLMIQGRLSEASKEYSAGLREFEEPFVDPSAKTNAWIKRRATETIPSVGVPEGNTPGITGIPGEKPGFHSQRDLQAALLKSRKRVDAMTAEINSMEDDDSWFGANSYFGKALQYGMDLWYDPGHKAGRHYTIPKKNYGPGPSAPGSPFPTAAPIEGTGEQSRKPAPDELVAAIYAAADKYNVPRALALAIAKQESGLSQDRISPKGAIGIMQLMPETAKDLGVNATDALQNIHGGVHYLSELLAKYGDESKAIAAYNAGPERVDRSKSLADLPPETRAYVPSVLRYEAQIEKAQQPDLTAVAEQPADNTRLQTPIHVKPAAYVPDVMNRDWSPKLAELQIPQAPAAQFSQSHHSTSVDVGGIYITQPGADAQTIQRVVEERMQEAMNTQVRYDQAQLSPVFA